MTDYNYWSKFNEEQAIKEIDNNDNIENFKKSLNKSKSNTNELIESTKEISDILSSKAKVEELKAKGRKKKSNQTENNRNTESAINNSLIYSNINELAHLFQSLTSQLSELVSKLDLLKKFTIIDFNFVGGYNLGFESFSSLQSTDKNINIIKQSHSLSTNDLIEFDITGLTNSYNTVYHQIVYYLSICSFNLCEFAITIELCRYLLKSNDNKIDSLYSTQIVYIWLLRGLAFIGMNNYYMAYIHIKRAKQLDNKYINIDDINNYVEILESQFVEYMINFELTNKEHITNEIVRFINLSMKSIYINSSNSIQCKSLFQSFDIINQQHFILLSSDNINDYSILTDMVVNGKPIDEICGYINVLKILCKRVYYEAQMLYHELLYYSSEIKYYVTLSFIDVIISYLNINPSINELNYYTILRSICLINIVSCKYHTIDDWDSISTNIKDNVKYSTYLDCLNCHILDTCNYSINMYDSVPGRYRKIIILEKMKCYDEAIRELNSLIDKLANNDNSYLNENIDNLLSNYSDNYLYTQMYIFPVVINQIDDKLSDSNTNILDNFIDILNNRINHIKYLKQLNN